MNPVFSPRPIALRGKGLCDVYNPFNNSCPHAVQYARRTKTVKAKPNIHALGTMDSVAGCFAGLKTFKLFQRTQRSPQKNRDAKFALGRQYADSRIACNEHMNHEIIEQISEPPPAYRGNAGGLVAYRPEVLETIKNAVDDIDADLRSLSLAIHGSLLHVLLHHMY